MLSEKEYLQIQRRYDEYSERDNGAYRAFMSSAHRDVGRLLDEVYRLRKMALPAISHDAKLRQSGRKEVA